MPRRSLNRTRRISRRKGGAINALINAGVNRGRGTPDDVKKRRKIKAIFDTLDRCSTNTLRNYTINHEDKVFNLDSV